MGRTLNRVAGIVSAGALITFAAAPAALAQETDTTTPETTETTAVTSETTTTTVPPTSETTTAPPVTTTGTTSAPGTTDVTKTTKPGTTTTTTSDGSEPPADDYQDNTGHGFVGVGGEGSLTINCASGKPGEVATQYLSVTGGPDQDGADGRIWHYSVRVDQLPPGTTTGKFSWTCGGVEGEGTVDFEQAPPPETSTTNPTTSTTTSTGAPTTTSTPSSTVPLTTITSTTTSTPGNAAPKAQVKVAPQGGIETGFGGTAW
ncbi:hypothetical protein VA596_10150 [Amycolatopsis sp., V23-08]|uniref:Serine/threonine protein kinase n=1 Tax=Amycolatopsis heterodermiae TaxID=3110235 RepID=A0ABU5R161_9PSEU|nr:hypothetical protein [Amycolatopsis sp., V23-08]MEA5359898.1 hypothetical protein [Amycolatopsis sp., V23-08]